MRKQRYVRSAEGKPMDMLDFDVDELYFDEALSDEARECIEQAAEAYGKSEAERLLLRANFLEPEHPMVLVALYRFFYYQHRYEDALVVAERVLPLFAARLGLARDWRQLDADAAAAEAMTSSGELRFYLLALKGAAYLELRLARYESAIERLRKIVALDEKDRLSAAYLLQIAQDEVGRQSGIYRLRF
jgi:tetratricopeptide (TPR) repeat protein